MIWNPFRIAAKAKQTPLNSAGLSEEKPSREFHVNVAGLTHPNNDGSNRFKIAKRSLLRRAQIDLIAEPDNIYDKHAVKVVSRFGQLGYLPSHIAKEISPILRGTSSYHKIEAILIEVNIVEVGSRKKVPVCKLLMRKYE